MSRGERKAMVRRDIPGLSLSRQCEVLSISRSSFYYLAKGESAENLALMRRLDEIYTDHPFYGVRQMRRVLKREGQRVNPKRIRRLMRLMGLEAQCPKPNLSQPAPGHKMYPYLMKTMTIDGANQAWCADITYIRLEGGCQGCGMADVTLKQGVAKQIQQVAPGITNVLDVTDHAGGDNPYYQPGKGGVSPL